jgi:hypothetical protein
MQIVASDGIEVVHLVDEEQGARVGFGSTAPMLSLAPDGSSPNIQRRHAAPSIRRRIIGAVHEIAYLAPRSNRSVSGKSRSGEVRLDTVLHV